VLVTGGLGFIGSAVVRHLVQGTGHTVGNVDLGTYAATEASVAGVAATAGDRYHHIRADIADGAAVERAFSTFRPEAVVHLAAETHVDRSIDGPEVFVRTNVVGTLCLLEAARRLLAAGTVDAGRFRFVHVSTDEVFGALDAHQPPFTEASSYAPRSPYAATKAGADHLARAWHHTYGVPVVVTNCSNNFGPYQFPEKLIPLVTLRALEGRELAVYGTGANVRDWLHVEDHARGLVAALEHGTPGATYLFGGGYERTNLEVVHRICDLVDRLAGPRPGRPRRGLVRFVEDRPGHDLRYAVDATAARRALGWAPRVGFEEGLARTVEWYLANEAWWRPLLARYDGARLGTAAR
jgi:dTDP-glucose 4,6-dehydratase